METHRRKREVGGPGLNRGRVSAAAAAAAPWMLSWACLNAGRSAFSLERENTYPTFLVFFFFSFSPDFRSRPRGDEDCCKPATGLWGPPLVVSRCCITSSSSLTKTLFFSSLASYYLTLLATCLASARRLSGHVAPRSPPPPVQPVSPAAPAPALRRPAHVLILLVARHEQPSRTLLILVRLALSCSAAASQRFSPRRPSLSQRFALGRRLHIPATTFAFTATSISALLCATSLRSTLR